MELGALPDFHQLQGKSMNRTHDCVYITPFVVVLVVVLGVTPTFAQPQWNEEGFWNTGKMAANGTRTRVGYIDDLGKYVYMEDGASETIRTGYETKLYQQIKTHAATSPQEMITPETMFNYALYASRDEAGNANAQTAMLTALNVTRLLARPQQWSDRLQKGGYAPTDAALPLLNDLVGSQSVDEQPPFPDLLVGQDRMKFLRKPNGEPVVPEWSFGLFSNKQNQVFSTMPGVEGETDSGLFQVFNGGSHYYFWTGAVAEMAAGRDAATAAVRYEQFTKWLGKGEEPEAARIEGANAIRGRDFSRYIRDKMTSMNDLLSFIEKSSDPDLRFLGMQSTTWWTAIRSTDIFTRLMRDEGDSLQYARLLMALSQAEQYALGGKQADPQKFLPIAGELGEKYLRLLQELLGDNADLSKLSAARIHKLLLQILDKIKSAIEPSTLINCRIVLIPPFHPDSQKAVEGTIQFASGRAEELNGKRELSIFFSHLNELDAFLRGGGIAMNLREPRKVTQLKVVTSPQLVRHDGNLGAQVTFIVYLTGFLKGDSNSINSNFLPMEEIKDVPGVGKDHAIGSMVSLGNGAAAHNLGYSIARHQSGAEARAVMAEYQTTIKKGFAPMKAVPGMELVDSSRNLGLLSITDLSWRSQNAPVTGTSYTMAVIYRDDFLIYYGHSGPGFKINYTKEAQEIRERCQKLIDLRFPREASNDPPKKPPA